jgi:hypothetical protein
MTEANNALHSRLLLALVFAALSALSAFCVAISTTLTGI